MKEAKTEIEKSLYKLYGIAEWKEKCRILSVDEQIEVLEDIKKGNESALLNLVRLPFPKFARTYFQEYPEAEPYFRDPTFEYKLFFIGPQHLQDFSNMIKNPDVPMAQYSKSENGRVTDSIQTLLNTNYEDLPKILNLTSNISDATRKIVYLSQYIDLEEAKRMGLSLIDRFISQGSDGYELEKKLNCLNPAARLLIIYHIGLYGEERRDIKEIAKTIGTYNALLESFINMVLPKLTLTYGEFRSFLGCKEEQDPDGMIQYTNKKIRDMDITIETNFILKKLESWELEILSNLNKRERVLYLAAKYMFTTPKSLASNMGLATKDAADRLNKLK